MADPDEVKVSVESPLQIEEVLATPVHHRYAKSPGSVYYYGNPVLGEKLGPRSHHLKALNRHQ